MEKYRFFINQLWGDRLSIHTIENRFQSVRNILEKNKQENVVPLIIVSWGEFDNRGQVNEIYGETHENVWSDFLAYYNEKKLDQKSYFRVDILTKEKLVSYEELKEVIGRIKRNNYGDFNFRVVGKKQRSFLMEELTGNAILKPSKKHRVGRNLPELSINEQNYRGYVKRKYGERDSDLSYLEQAVIYIFETQAFYFEADQAYSLKDYGNGNRVRAITYSNLAEMTNLVIHHGTDYLKNQLTSSGQFIYGYFPCYDQEIKGYNSVRHFSSLYALCEAAQYLKAESVYSDLSKGILWGIQQLTSTIHGYTMVGEPLNTSIEYKLGAQATAILAIAKYAEVTGDTQFNSFLKKLIMSVEDKFMTKDNRTIHVLNEDLSIKETFRIVYYDGEILFALLRAYGIFREEKILRTCEALMKQFIENDYQKYHDHWLSYATNEFLKYQEKQEYYRFGLNNALGNIRFIDKRDTAYPTMLELLVAASKMVDKLAVSEMKPMIFQKEEEFLAVKDRINAVMKKRVQHELSTGVMFPEFAQFFKKPSKISYGFFARHDRFRMRIDDAEHFLSGLINFRLHEMEEKKLW